ncbi:MAG: hypothetical protein QXJ03_02945 [Desulfurococcus sp.]|uniref:hypothetical protein n=1 Tax=Desulfurococcus sp. TaxID=51678 RepID=UPI003163D063
MSLVEEERSSVSRMTRSSRNGGYSGGYRRVFAAYPGEDIGFAIAINGPLGHVVSISAEGPSPSVATITVAPSRGFAPYTSGIKIHVNNGAPPGLYSFNLIITNESNRRLLGREPIGLLVLPRSTPKALEKRYLKLRELYRELGAQAVMWCLLAKIFTNGATFSQLKEAYELIREKPVRKATIAVILRRMARKGLVEKDSDSKYYPLVTKEEVAFSRIDKKRVRIPQQLNASGNEEMQEASLPERQLHEPYVAKLAFRRAQKIAMKHGKLAAAYFLVFSLVGARETGYLLLWLNSMFAYCEQKVESCHYFYSQLLHHYFQLLRLREGIMYKQIQEYLEAIDIANKYVRKYYGSHQSSRTLHYELKKQGYLEYDSEIYNAEIIYYEDGDVGVRIWDNNMEEVEYEENIVDKPIVKREIKPVYPFKHIYEYNEETYFHRPGGLY